MSEEVVTTYWLTRDGDIATHVVYKDESGRVYGESGDPAPAGTELDSHQVADILRKRVIQQVAAHEANENAILKRYELRVKDREEKIATLVASGISPEAAEIICPPFGPPPAAKPYTPHPNAEAGVRSYGLNEVQVRQVLSARE